MLSFPISCKNVSARLQNFCRIPVDFLWAPYRSIDREKLLSILRKRILGILETILEDILKNSLQLFGNLIENFSIGLLDSNANRAYQRPQITVSH